jgi:hypothetical protein
LSPEERGEVIAYLRTRRAGCSKENRLTEAWRTVLLELAETVRRR